MNREQDLNQNRSQGDDLQHASVQAVLDALREARPTPDFEDRMLQRLGSQQLQTSRGVRRWSLALAIPAALTACIVCAVTVRQQRATHGILDHTIHSNIADQPANVHKRDLLAHAPSSNHLEHKQKPQAFPSTAADSTPASPQNNVISTGATAPPSRSGETRFVSAEAKIIAGTSQTASSGPVAGDQSQPQQQASFPAPEMPITEEERLLLQIAHRNDPVQVALLDPHERNLTIARERAESRRFFAPRPLPPELQQQIDAAVREQYALAQQPIQEKPIP